MSASMRPVAPPSILKQDPRGRVDVAIVRFAEVICKKGFGDGGAAVWDGGLGDFVEAIVVGNGISSQPVTIETVTEELGLVPRRRVANPRRKRS